MNQLFRKESMDRRSRALFGDVLLRGPLPLWAVVCSVGATLLLVGFILFGIEVGDQTVWRWLRD